MSESVKQAIALGREHYEKREYEKAERYLAKVIAREQGYADIHNMMGVIQHDKGALQEARQSFEAALGINPKYTEAALNLSVTLNDLGLYEQAQGIYKSAIHFDASGSEEVDPYARGKIANLHAEVAQAYLEVGMVSEAIAELRNAIALCPTFADLRVRLAQAYQQIGDLVAARFELEEAIRVRPDYHSARNSLGILLLVSGQREQAISTWEQALERDPENRGARAYLRMVEGLK
ncbi:MAG: tetratricopeptide repeat protein [Myxococcales bacterium]|nr:tetratricopeptide repeat protein [Myxococcales bacterium]